MKKRTIAAIISILCLLAFCLAGCGSAPTESAGGESSAAGSESSSEGQNGNSGDEITPYLGTYMDSASAASIGSENMPDETGTILIEATEDGGVDLSISWAKMENGASSTTNWYAKGTFDKETMTITYQGCSRNDMIFNAEGDLESETETYTGGTGTIVIKESDPLTLTWNDDVDNYADGTVYEFFDSLDY